MPTGNPIEEPSGNVNIERRSGLASDSLKTGKVSIVIPVYNEIDTIRDVVQAVLDLPFEKEIIIVNDRSTDGTGRELRIIERNVENVDVYHHGTNRGKGAAIRTGLEVISGDVVVLQDADLELDPSELPRLVEPVLAGRTNVVYGSRFLKYQGEKNLNYLANRVLTALTNLLTGEHLTDMETCYKIFSKDVARSISIESDGFNMEPEITAKISRNHYEIQELPVTYRPRNYEEGKKITWLDGVKAISAIFWYSWS